ncbi:hypothetical protein HY450_02205 [Candidatus Pacearchaeota archaeon]|nr:hypothetical protein [Candidatus Pacearchaeota archaeon]
MMGVKNYQFAKNFIFFLNVFIALIIIASSWMLVKTEFGRNSLVFGFIMLSISTMLKIVQKW